MAKLLQRNISLKNYSNFKIGGIAKYFLEIYSLDALNQGLEEWHEIAIFFDKSQKKTFVLGDGTNVLFDDKGFDGLVIHNNMQGINLSGENIVAYSGVRFQKAIEFALKESLKGIEWAGGLPGTIGGAVRGNAGAFGAETKDSVFFVESIDLDTLEIKKRSNKECFFSYRTSVFKTPDAENEMITKVSLSLTPGDKKEIEKIANENIAYRNARHPLEYPNIGSIFKNIPFDSISKELKEKFEPWVKNDPFPIVPVAKILVELGLKGKRIGGAQVSEKHPNYIVNIDNASSDDVKNLIVLVKKEVKDRCNITLEEEVVYVS